MSAIKNLASSEYRTHLDKAVKTELEAAGISVIALPSYMNSEVKTSYIGMLNGFVFWRAWRYWVCRGNMPLHHAKEIYYAYHTLMVRAEGHAGNIDPVGYDPELESRQEKLAKELFAKNVSATEVIAAAEKLKPLPNSKRFVRQYHIDTTEGLEALASYIRQNNIYACDTPGGREGT